MKEYRSFASKDARHLYVCKSEIDGALLKEFSLEGIVSVKELLYVFKMLIDLGEYIVVPVGNSINPKQRRRTKFVKKKTLLFGVMKYLKG